MKTLSYEDISCLTQLISLYPGYQADLKSALASILLITASPISILFLFVHSVKQ